MAVSASIIYVMIETRKTEGKAKTVSEMDTGAESREYLAENETNQPLSRGSSSTKVNVAELRAPRQRLVFADPAAFRCVTISDWNKSYDY